YDRAGEKEKALEFALAAADQSTNVGAFDNAEQMLRVAIKNSAADARAKERLGNLFIETGRFADGELIYKELVALYEAQQNEDSEIHARLQLLRIEVLKGNRDTSTLESVEALRARAEEKNLV